MKYIEKTSCAASLGWFIEAIGGEASRDATTGGWLSV